MTTSDEGLLFHALLRKADGGTRMRATSSRRELLLWIRQHCEAGDTVVEVGMTARDPAVAGMLAAMTFGAAKLAREIEALTCPHCGRTSFNPNDIRERYCGECHAFLDDRREAE